MRRDEAEIAKFLRWLPPFIVILATTMYFQNKHTHTYEYTVSDMFAYVWVDIKEARRKKVLERIARNEVCE